MSGERIETAGELDALPVGSVVEDAEEHAFFRQDPDGRPIWSCQCAEAWMTSEHVVEEAGVPLTVVYRPDRDLLAEAEARGARKWLRWAADHLTDGKSYEDIAFLDPWEAVMVCSRIIRARAEQIGDDRG